MNREIPKPGDRVVFNDTYHKEWHGKHGLYVDVYKNSHHRVKLDNQPAPRPGGLWHFDLESLTIEEPDLLTRELEIALAPLFQLKLATSPKSS